MSFSTIPGGTRRRKIRPRIGPTGFGQRRQVTVVRLISKGTVEENILRLQESKRELADRIVTTGTVSLAGLNREEILRLLE